MRLFFSKLNLQIFPKKTLIREFQSFLCITRFIKNNKGLASQKNISLQNNLDNLSILRKQQRECWFHLLKRDFLI